MIFKILYIIYNLFLTILVFPVLFTGSALFILWRPERRTEFLQKFGIQRPVLNGKGPVIWVHAVSVGEMLLAEKMLTYIYKQFKNAFPVFTTTTYGAFELGKKRLPIPIFYFPFDIQPVMLRFFNALQPSCVIVVETEIWPNFLHIAHRRRIPVYLTNGIIGEPQFRNYMLLKPFFSRLLSYYRLLLMQRQDDTKRVLALGASPARVRETGNIKYDVQLPRHRTSPLQSLLQITREQFIICAASTHKGEEEILMRAFLDAAIPNSRLIIAPRHVQRADTLYRRLRGIFPLIQRRSRPQATAAPVVLLDTLGELMDAFQLSQLVFMGGSIRWGGHNIIEPGILKKPVIVGPCMENFSQIYHDFSHAEAVYDCDGTAAGIAESFQNLYQREETRRCLGKNAYQLIRSNRNITQSIIRHIADDLKSQRITL